MGTRAAPAYHPAPAPASGMAPGTEPSFAQRRDTAATALVATTGGSVTLPAFATVSFPAGAFSAPQAVTIEATSLPEWRAIFDVLASIYESAAPLSYEIRVTTGRVAPATDFEVAIVVPDTYLSALPSGYIVELFALVVQGGPDERIERFKPFPSAFDARTRVVQAELPKRIFDSNQRMPGIFEAVLMIGSKRG
ncbi:MAG: hypothetical protein ACRDHF_13980 [Tepidiformaceae bacterium]